MKYISCRKNFDDQNEFSLDGKNHSYFGSTFLEDDELILVHGYNTVARDVEDAYRSNKEIYAENNGQRKVVGYLWPGLGETKIESLEFHKAQSMALKSSSYFADYFDTIPRATHSPVVVTHSLGAQVVLDALLQYDIHIDTLALTGPAVEADCLSTKYKDVFKKVGKILVFWSSHDPVLARIFQLDQMKTALGASGPTEKLPQVESIEMSANVWAHSDYRFSRGMWQKIALY